MELKITKEDCEKNGLGRNDVIKIILKQEDYKIFKIYADYKKAEPHPFYFMMGKDKEKIKKLFKERYTWLDIYKIEEIEYDKNDDYTLDFLSRNMIIAR